MTFERPELLALAPLAVLIVSLAVTAQWRRGLRLLDAFGGPAPAGRLAPVDLRPYPVGRAAALVLLAFALVVAAAGPTAVDPLPTSDRPVDLVVALDLSLSMSADDVEGGRAERAREVLARVVEAMAEERVGLAVFADWPYTLVPPTHDLDVVRYFGASLSPELVSDRDQGSGIGAVVTHARASLERRRREDADAVILLVTDGESLGEVDAVLDSVAIATTDGVRLWTAGLGTPGGAALLRPGSPGDPLVDESGSAVVSRLDEDLLRRMAAAGGGRYHDVSRDAGLRALIDDLAGPTRQAATPDRWPPPTFWLTLLALPLLLWEGWSDTSRSGRRGQGS